MTDLYVKPNDEGYYFFPFGAIQDRNYYPTDGQGGSGELFTGQIEDSHMFGWDRVLLVRVLIIFASSDALRIRRADNNVLIDSLALDASEFPVGSTVELGWEINIDNGFTLSVSSAFLQGVGIYQRLHRSL